MSDEELENQDLTEETTEAPLNEPLPPDPDMTGKCESCGDVPAVETVQRKIGGPLNVCAACGEKIRAYTPPPAVMPRYVVGDQK